jgi:hypothetical protein
MKIPEKILKDQNKANSINTILITPKFRIITFLVYFLTLFSTTTFAVINYKIPIYGKKLMCAQGKAIYTHTASPGLTYSYSTLPLSPNYNPVTSIVQGQCVVDWTNISLTDNMLIIKGYDNSTPPVLVKRDTIKVKVLKQSPFISLTKRKQCIGEVGVPHEGDSTLLTQEIYLDGGPCIRVCDSTCVLFRASDMFYGHNDSFRYEWVINNAIPSDSSSGNPFQTFYQGDSANICWGAAGSYTLTLRQIAFDSCIKTITICVIVEDVPPVKILSTIDELDLDTVYLCKTNYLLLKDVSPFTLDWHDYFIDWGDLTEDNGDYDTTAPYYEHEYVNTGTYVVKFSLNSRCHCSGLDSLVVIVSPEDGPTIKCPSIVCGGDTIEYSTPDTCAPYSWTAINGTIVPPTNANKVKVLWDKPSDGYGYIILDATKCGKSCPISRIKVPIKSDSLKLTYPPCVLQGGAITISAPPIPGANYLFDIDQAGTINSQGFSSKNSFSVPCYISFPNSINASIKIKNNFGLNCIVNQNILMCVKDTIVLIGPDTVCLKSFGSFNVNIQTGIDSFIIFNPQGSIVHVCTNTNWCDYQFMTTGRYKILLVDDQYGTTKIKYVDVISIQPPQGIVGTQNVCPGLPIEYEAIESGQSGSYIQWTVAPGATIHDQIGNKIWVSFPNIAGLSRWIKAQSKMLSSPFCESTPIHLPIILNIYQRDTSTADTLCENSVQMLTVNDKRAELYAWKVLEADKQLGSILSKENTPNPVIQLNSIPINQVFPKVRFEVTTRWCGIVRKDTITVYLKPAPATAIIVPDTVCMMNKVFINTTSDGIYEWVIPPTAQFVDGTTKNNRYVHVLFAQPGTFNITLLVSKVGECAVSRIMTKTIVVKNAPTITITTLDKLQYCAPDSTISSTMDVAVLNAGTFTYQWYRNGIAITGETSISYTASTTGTYYCIVVDVATGCPRRSNDMLITYGACPARLPCLFGGEAFDFTQMSDSICGRVIVHNISDTCFHNITFTCIGCDEPSIQSSNTVIFKMSTPGYYKITMYGKCTCDSIIEKNILIPVLAKMNVSAICTPSGRSMILTSLSEYMTGHAINMTHWTVWKPNGTIVLGLTTPFSLPANDTGRYIIRLWVSDAHGHGCVIYDTIRLGKIPKALFTSTPALKICDKQTMTFLADSADGQIFTYKWYYGAGGGVYIGGPKSAKEFARIFINPTTLDARDISLVISDKFGCRDSISIVKFVTANTLGGSNTPLHSNICEGESKVLSYSFNSNLNGTPTFYKWNNETITKPYPPTTSPPYKSIPVTTSGYYYVSVSDNNGCSFVPTPDAKVVVSPNPNFIIDGPAKGCMCMPYTITVKPSIPSTSTHPLNWTKQYWTGTSWQSSVGWTPLTNAMSKEVECTPGLYRYAATRVSPAGCASTPVYYEIEIMDTPSLMTKQNTIQCHPFRVELDAQINPGSLPGGQYSWSHSGDGPLDTVKKGGVYKVTYTTPHGCQTVGWETVQGPPDFSSLDISCIKFCTNANPNGAFLPVNIPGLYDKWEWMNELNGNVSNISSGSLTPIPDSLPLPMSGTYWMYIQHNGCRFVSKIIYVNLTDCQCYCDVTSNFKENYLTQDSCQVEMSADVISKCGGLVKNYWWYTSDGDAAGPSQQPTYQPPVYKTDSMRLICLVTETVDPSNTAPGACMDTICKGYKALCAPVCSCEVVSMPFVDVNKCTGIFKIEIMNTPPCVLDVAFLWRFGDGDSSTEFETEHKYKRNGSYQACLITTQTLGNGKFCRDTQCIQVCITDCPCACVPNIKETKFSTNDAGNCNYKVYFVPNIPKGCIMIDKIWTMGDGTLPFRDTSKYIGHKFKKNGKVTTCIKMKLYNPATGDTCIYTECRDHEVKCDVCCPITFYNIKPMLLNTYNCSYDFHIDMSLGDCTPIGYIWEWGDGKKTISKIPRSTHSYIANKIYKVCVSAIFVKSIGDTCYQTYCQDITILCKTCPQFCKTGMSNCNFPNATKMSDCIYKLTSCTPTNSCAKLFTSWTVDDKDTVLVGDSVYYRFKTPGKHKICANIARKVYYTSDTCYTSACLDIEVECTCTETPVYSIFPMMKNARKTTEIQLATAPGYISKLFPNPATNEIHLQVDYPRMEDLKILIKDNLSNTVMQSSIAISEKLKTLNISTLASSSYMVVLMTKDGKVVERLRFVKE